jgi:putative tryptophan/tyrosine transport system substrate-binding protein
MPHRQGFFPPSRREFITLLGGAAAWPLAARSQQGGMRRVGVLSIGANDAEMQLRMAAFRQGLAALGRAEGPNLRIEERWAAGDAERLRAAAAELLGLKPDIILASGGRALEVLVRATNTLPIVFIGLSDPVGQGFVASMARPGANVTGFSLTEATIVGKTLEELKEIAPRLTRVALVAQRENPNFPVYMREFDRAGAALGVRPVATPISEAAEIESTLAGFAREPNGGLVVVPDLFMAIHFERVIALAARHGLPAAYPYRSYVASGGLMSYGVDNVDIYRRVAAYIDRILKGEKPSELPVQAPVKFELVINLKTAKALGLDLPSSFYWRADEVIE